MIITTLIHINGEPRIIVESNTGRKIIKDGIERDISIDFPGEEVNYIETNEPIDPQEIVDILIGELVD